jgi:hypothetical protein
MCLGPLAGLAAASCAGTVLLPTPLHATGPADLKVGKKAAAPTKEGPEKALPHAFPMEEFLDRLVIAESGGRLRGKNPRSTALGPFQFIESTFLFVVSRHFPSEVANLTRRQVLVRRTDMAFSRRAARAYVHDLISALASKGLPASPVNVRIAFLVGPSAAVRLLGSPPDRPLNSVLSADAIAANAFMSGMTIAQLVQKAAVEVGTTPADRRLAPPKGVPAVDGAASTRDSAATLVALQAEPPSAPIVSKSGSAGTPIDPHDEPGTTTSAGPLFRTKCQIGLASCRRWMALQERKAQAAVPSAER